jgi:hypothetical protein
VPTAGWTKVPNALIDRHLPELRDTELRIVLVLVRATAGWNRGGRPAALTYRTLERLTGRHSEAIAAALATLRERGLIHVSGRPPVRITKLRASERRGQQTKTD